MSRGNGLLPAALLRAERIGRIDPGCPPRRNPCGEARYRYRDEPRHAKCSHVGRPDAIQERADQPRSRETDCKADPEPHERIAKHLARSSREDLPSIRA